MWRSSVKLSMVLFVAALGGCGDGGSQQTSDAGRQTGGSAASGCVDRCVLAEWSARPPAAPVSTETQLARDQILGPDATDPNYVRLWWFGVSSFVASINGHLLLLDAWETVGMQENYVPIGREELAAIQPEVILIGHGHFDHAADAGYVAAHSGALVVGSEVICDQVKEDADEAMPDGAKNFSCLITGVDENNPPPGTVQSVKIWTDLPPVTIVQTIHSAANPEPHDPGTPFIHIPNLTNYIEYLNTNPEEMARFLPTLEDQPGGAWAYHLRTGDFSLLWYDSTGPISDGNPFAEEVQSALFNLPGCVDVQAGAIVGFNQPLNGLRDPRLYVEHAHPRVFLPSHHDTWAPAAGGGAEAYESEWRNELATLEHPPALDYLRDPEDFMNRRSYRVDDPQWKIPMPGSACAGNG